VEILFLHALSLIEDLPPLCGAGQTISQLSLPIIGEVEHKRARSANFGVINHQYAR
jgi:hypothetical protein